MIIPVGTHLETAKTHPTEGQMRLFLLPSSFKGEHDKAHSLEIVGKEYNYLVNALRLKEGQKIMGRDRSGALWDLTIDEICNGHCKLTAEPTQEAIEYTDALPQQRPLKPIVLYQCLPKGRKTDDIVKRATEAGVQAIVLVKSRNCVADISGKESSKLSRYDAVIKEAIQQSGSVVPTTVEGPIDISKIPEDLKRRANGSQTLGLVLHQCELEKDQSDLLGTVKGFEGTTAIVVGSEGGLTNEECNKLLQAGFKAILLKTNILRCETASIYAIGAIQTILESTCS